MFYERLVFMSLHSFLLCITRNTSLPLSLRKKIGNKLHGPTESTFDVQLFGQTYRGQAGVHLDEKVYRYNLHEAPTIRLLRSIAQWQQSQGQESVFWDIGSNSGLHLITVAPLVSQAVGFEPWDKIRSHALSNISRNNQKQVQVMPFGLSNQDALLNFNPPDGRNYGVGYFTQNDSSTKLQVKCGDAVANDLKAVPSMMKIDVEGHEKSVLEGLKNTIKANRPAIVFEYAGSNITDFKTVNQRESLFGQGYTYWGIKRSREYPKLVPFKPGDRYENVLAWPETHLPAFR